MVAFSSSRRRSPASNTAYPSSVDSLVKADLGQQRTAFQAGASRRDPVGLHVYRDRSGRIIQIHIGRWRVLSTSSQRRIAEIRELADSRLAVRIERFSDGGQHPTSEIWQVYDLSGRLDAALQTSCDGSFAVLSDYQARRACRMLRNARNKLEAVEMWNF